MGTLHTLMAWFRRLLQRRPGPEGVPPVGVREPRRTGPHGRSGAVAVMEPED